MSKIVDYTENNYGDFEHYEGLAVIRFHALWCAPCVQSMPMFEQLAQQYDEQVMFGRVNIDLAPILTLRYNVFGLPSTLIFKDGVIKERIAGVKAISSYAARIRQMQQN